MPDLNIEELRRRFAWVFNPVFKAFVDAELTALDNSVYDVVDGTRSIDERLWAELIFSAEESLRLKEENEFLKKALDQAANMTEWDAQTTIWGMSDPVRLTDVPELAKYLFDELAKGQQEQVKP